MIAHRTRAQLKTEVKNLLRSNWKKAILLYLIPLIIFATTAAYNDGRMHVSAQYDINSFASFARFSSSFGIISFLISMVFLLINQSANFRALDWMDDKSLEFDPIKSNFTYFRSPDWWQLIFIYVITSLFTLLWSLLLIIPGIVKAIGYSQTYLIYKDLNDRGLTDGFSLTTYITKSQQLMMGNKWRYFVLQLSFIGWWILGFITLGIGFIWIFPYYKLTMVDFYRDLVEKNADYL